MNSNRINTYFNKVSANYSDESDGFIWNLLRRPEKQAFFKSFLDPKKNGSFLDIGAETGFYTKYFLHSGHDITCLDSSEMMIKKLSELKINVVFGNVEEMDLKGQYDVIFMLGVLEFLKTPWLAITKVHHLLKDDGHLYVFFPRKNFFGLMYRNFHLLHGFKVHLFSKAGIVKKMDELNLKVDDIQAAGFFNFIVRLKKI